MVNREHRTVGPKEQCLFGPPEEAVDLKQKRQSKRLAAPNCFNNEMPVTGR
jgi:hypothetical protein